MSVEKQKKKNTLIKYILNKKNKPKIHPAVFHQKMPIAFEIIRGYSLKPLVICR